MLLQRMLATNSYDQMKFNGDLFFKDREILRILEIQDLSIKSNHKFYLIIFFQLSWTLNRIFSYILLVKLFIK